MELLYFLLCLSYANFFYVTEARSLRDRIIGGQVKKITDVPHQASFEYNGKHKCGASIISESWLLTAAHCFHNKIELTKNGNIRIGTAIKAIGGELLNITQVILHPNYNHRELDNDIALVQVTPEIKFDETKKPIYIVESNEIPKAEQMMSISGFGRDTLKGSSRTFPFLKGATVKIIEDYVCERAYFFVDPNITPNMFCAESRPNDACTGDSGGPAVIKGKLAGVISNGYECATGRFPGVYTKIYKYHDWIVEKANLTLH